MALTELFAPDITKNYSANSDKYEKALDIFLEYSTNMAQWALVGLGGITLFIFSDQHKSSLNQLNIFLFSGMFFISSIFFFATIFDVSIRMLHSDQYPLAYGGIMFLSRLQFFLLLAGLGCLAINIATLAAGGRKDE